MKTTRRARSPAQLVSVVHSAGCGLQRCEAHQGAFLLQPCRRAASCARRGRGDGPQLRKMVARSSAQASKTRLMCTEPQSQQLTLERWPSVTLNGETIEPPLPDLHHAPLLPQLRAPPSVRDASKVAPVTLLQGSWLCNAEPIGQAGNHQQIHVLALGLYGKALLLR
jgi:hypothetical protein